MVKGPRISAVSPWLSTKSVSALASSSLRNQAKDLGVPSVRFKGSEVQGLEV